MPEGAALPQPCCALSWISPDPNGFLNWSPSIHLLPHPLLTESLLRPQGFIPPKAPQQEATQKMGIKPRDLIKTPKKLCMRHLHLLGRDSHAGTDHVQGVGDHGSRGASQGAGNEARERCQRPEVRGEKRPNVTCSCKSHPAAGNGSALPAGLSQPSHRENPREEEAQGMEKRLRARLESAAFPALCFACSFPVLGIARSMSRPLLAHAWT